MPLSKPRRGKKAQHAAKQIVIEKNNTEGKIAFLGISMFGSSILFFSISGSLTK